MNINKIPDYILDDLRSRGLTDRIISKQTPEFLFEEYCNWQGLIGWSDSLITVLDDLREADK